MPDNELYWTIVKERNQYSAGPNHDRAAWWYISGLADARSGYGNAKEGKGTVHYAGLVDDGMAAAYDLGYLDGIGTEDD